MMMMMMVIIILVANNHHIWFRGHGYLLCSNQFGAHCASPITHFQHVLLGPGLFNTPHCK